MGKMKEYFINKIRQQEIENTDVHADDEYWYNKWQEDLTKPQVIQEVEHPFITYFKDEDGKMCIISGRDETELRDIAKKHGVTSDFEVIQIEKILR